MPIVPLILCGGSGTRLWPASRDSHPKQFLPLFDALSTFQETLQRVRAPELFAPPVIITNQRHRQLVAAQLDELDIHADIVLEPEARDSGPAILAGALFVARSRGKDAILMALASDHVIRDVEGFHAACRQALVAAQSSHIVTFGVTPDHPATGYGYIEPGLLLECGARAVVRFVEKPDFATAEDYVGRGYLWNSGNFLARAAVLIEAYRDSDPATVTALTQAVDKARTSGRAHHLDAAAFAQATKLSFDYAVMERSTRTAVVAAAFDWSDVGSWAAVRALSARDQAGNAAKGPVVLLQAENNLVSSAGPLVTLVGVNNLAVVATGDAVLVARGDDSAGIKKLVEQLRKSHTLLTQKHAPATPSDPAATFIDLAQGGRLSMPGPRTHARHWLIINGTARIAIADEIRRLGPHESFHLPREATCILESEGPEVLRILEIELPDGRRRSENA